MDGRKAWTMAFIAAATNAVVYSVLLSFGIFFDAMADDFDSGRGATAVLFALTTAMQFGLGAFTGPASDRFGPRPFLIVGGVLVPLGLFLTSLAPNLFAACASYGLLVGGGVACLIVPMLAAVASWFEEKRAVGMATVLTGNGVGGMLGPPIYAAIVDAEGFRTAFAVAAIACAVMIAVSAAVIRRSPKAAMWQQAPTIRAALDVAVHRPGFARLYLSTVFATTAFFIPLVFLAPYVKSEGASAGEAAAIVSIAGAASIVGRLALGLRGKRDSMQAFQSCGLVLAAAMAIWLVARGDLVVMAAFAVVFGAATGGRIALGPAVTAQLFGASDLGSTLGLLYTASAVSALVGPPLAGASVDITGGYTTAIVIAGLLAFASWAVLRPVTRSAGPTRAPLATRV